MIKYSNVDSFDLYFSSGEDFIEVQVEDEGAGCNPSQIKDPFFDENRSCGGLGIYIIKTLMDDVEVVSHEENGTIIYMKKIIGRDE